MSKYMKTVLITGATSGIGEACAQRFAKEGYRLIITGRNQEKLQQLQNVFAANKTEVLPLCFDIRNRQAMEQAIATLPDDWKTIDVLINNAGLALGLDKADEAEWNDWETMVDTNIKGLLAMTHYVVPMMVKQGFGHVINIGSIAGDAAYPKGSVYCATKAAVKVFTDGLRIDLSDTPIRVTNIKPGLVETNFSVVRFYGDHKRADDVYKGIKPLTGIDIADVAYYVAAAPSHVQIAEVTVLATHQANATTIIRENV